MQKKLCIIGLPLFLILLFSVVVISFTDSRNSVLPHSLIIFNSVMPRRTRWTTTKTLFQQNVDKSENTTGSNLLLNNEGKLKLADFGLAKSFGTNREGQLKNRVAGSAPTTSHMRATRATSMTGRRRSRRRGTWPRSKLPTTWLKRHIKRPLE